VLPDLDQPGVAARYCGACEQFAHRDGDERIVAPISVLEPGLGIPEYKAISISVACSTVIG
jgi:hypothetical protein